jgi:hypothetical protein
MRRPLLVTATTAVAVLLAGCFSLPGPRPTETNVPAFVTRQLDPVLLSADDYGPGWTLAPGEEGSGGGEIWEYDAGDPCGWSSAWLPSYDTVYLGSWRKHVTADGVTSSSSWVIAVDSPEAARELLDEYEQVIAACQPVSKDDGQGAYVVTVAPTEPTGLGDASLSYRADHAEPGGEVYGSGEVHMFLCGALLVQLSYIGYEQFVERDALLALLEERAAPVGGC